MKIFVFSLNTQSLRFYESLSEEVVRLHRTDTVSGWLYNGIYADFLPELLEKIKQSDADIVVFCSQEEVFPGSYFHTHLLRDVMNEMLYSLYDDMSLMGVGKTSVKNILKGDPTVRGLVCSVYVKEQIHFTSPCPRKKYLKNCYTDSVFRNKGATCIYLTLSSGSQHSRDITLAIVNAHLPFDASSLVQSVQKKDAIIRQDALNKQNDFFNAFYRHLILNSPAVNDNFCAVLAGDFNYRFLPYFNWSASQTRMDIMRYFPLTPEKIPEFRKMFAQNDEFTIQKEKKNIYSVDEGPDNGGPLFPPTCKLDTRRNPGTLFYKTGKWDQRTPSYCDRILHKNLTCLEYDIFNVGNISLSDHVAVYGIYEISL